MSGELLYNPTILYGTISTPGSVSTSIDLKGYAAVAIIVPGTVLGTLITFQAADYSGNFYPVYDSAGNRVSAVYGTAGNRVITDIPELFPIRQLKIETSGTQSADKVFGVLVK